MRRASLWLLATSLTALLAGCAVVEGPPARPYPRYRAVYPEYPVYTVPGPVIYAPPPGVFVRPAVPPGHLRPAPQWRSDGHDHRQASPPHRAEDRLVRRERPDPFERRAAPRTQQHPHPTAPRRGPAPHQINREEGGGP